MSGGLRHEPWCDPEHCTADAKSRARVHRSTPFTVDLGDVIQGHHRQVGPVTAWLEREVGPGVTTTYLRIQPRDGANNPDVVLRFPITTVYNLVQVLDGITGRPPARQPVDDYVRENLETGRPLPPYVSGYRAGGPVARAVIVGRNAPGRFTTSPRGRVGNRV